MFKFLNSQIVFMQRQRGWGLFAYILKEKYQQKHQNLWLLKHFDIIKSVDMS